MTSDADWSRVAQEAMSLAIAWLDVSNLSKAQEWSGAAAQLGYPGAAELNAACARLDSVFRAVAAAPPSPPSAMRELHAAGSAVGELMVATAKALGEEISESAQGFADSQVLRAADLSFATRLFEQDDVPGNQ